MLISVMGLSVTDADHSDVDLDDVDVRQQYDGKIGTKKLRKLEEKAARRAQREVGYDVHYFPQSFVPRWYFALSKIYYFQFVQYFIK